MKALDKKNIKIVLLENIHPTAVKFLKDKGFSNIITFKDSPSQDVLIDAIKDAHLIGLRSRTKLTKELIDKAKNLMAVGCFCIGTEQVDYKYAKELGIPVFNAPYSNTRSVAELVIAEALGLMRKISVKNGKAHKGIWDKSATGCFEVKGKTIGIIGYGHIGMQVGLMAEALNMNVVYYDIEKKLTLGSAKPMATLDELLKISDIVTLHVPGNGDTQNMIGKKQLEMMKKGAILLNIARGKLVDVDALAEALRSGHLSGAGVDVFPTEPKGKDEAFVSPLTEFDNVILTPHIGGSTEEAQENIALDVAEKFSNFILAGSTFSAINFPEINLTEKPNVCRILHIHKNLPGVMKEINKIFGDYNVNISAQYLQTDSYLGYVAMDIENDKISDEIVEKLKQVIHTIKVIVI